jgi:phosphohistidine phosphatase
MELYFFRHGIAVDRGMSGCKLDSERPLTPKGEQKVFNIANGLLNQGVSFDLMLTSPYLRARRTAEILAKVFMAEKKLKTSASLSPDADPMQLIAELNANRPVAKRVMLVGHEPFLSDLASTLLTGTGTLSMTLKKGGVCKLSAPGLRYGRCAKLEWLLAPRQLKKLG